LYQPGRGTIEANHARSAFAFDDIRLEARTVVVVYDLDFFIGDDVCRIHQILINGNASHIVEFGLRNAYPVDFGFQYLDNHDAKVHKIKIFLIARYFTLGVIASKRAWKVRTSASLRASEQGKCVGAKQSSTKTDCFAPFHWQTHLLAMTIGYGYFKNP